jgi:hypothetical protein
LDDVIDEAVRRLLDGFVTSLRQIAAVEAVWLHGSLTLGDFQVGRSDLDVVAVVSSPPPAAIADLHRRLIATSPLAGKLDCSYLVASELADPAIRHATFAQGRYFDRPVTPVTRRELALSNVSLYGPPPSSLLPPTSDDELFAFIRRRYGPHRRVMPWWRHRRAVLTRRFVGTAIPSVLS